MANSASVFQQPIVHYHHVFWVYLGLEIQFTSHDLPTQRVDRPAPCGENWACSHRNKATPKEILVFCVWVSPSAVGHISWVNRKLLIRRLVIRMICWSYRLNTTSSVDLIFWVTCYTGSIMQDTCFDWHETRFKIYFSAPYLSTHVAATCILLWAVS